MYEVETRDNMNMIVMENIPEYDTEDYDLFDDKDKRKYIEDIKRSVRGSFEYRQLVDYLRRYCDMNQSAFFENVTNIDTFKIKIHIHHSPLTLEDYVVTVFNKRMFYNESLEVEDVAKEVMSLHYYFMVGLIPLGETEHQLTHNGYLFIPTNKVMGNYNEFLETYKEWVPDEVLEKVRSAELETSTYDEYKDKLNSQILQMNPIMIQMGNEPISSYLPKMEDVKSIMEQKMEEIRYQNKYSLPQNSEYDNIVDERKDEDVVLVKGIIYNDDLIRGISYI